MDSNKPNPWPNKLPIHITFDRPKPWPDDYPLNTIPKPRISSTTEAASQKLKQAKEGKPYQYQLQVRMKSVGQLRAFQVVDHNWDQFQHWNLPTTSCAIAAVDFKLLLTVHTNLWIVLPVFDPGDFRSKEEEGKISFDCNEDLGHFGRILDEIQRRTKVSGRRLGESRRIGIVLEENRRRIKEEVAGLVKKKKLWFVEERFGVVKEEEEFGCRLPEEEKVRDLDLKVWEILVKQRSQEEKGNMVCKGLTRNPISNAAFSTLEFGLVGSPFGEPGQTHKWTDWTTFAIINSFSFLRFGPPTELDHYCN